ncbi:MAG TPA: YceD family protein [Allosphingosinicella sp.]|jgi:uncharacterized metal-binding protein YceD (DUF177 family)
MTPPEFSRPVRIDTLGESPRAVSIEANEGEREALAMRFGFVAISALSAELSLIRRGEAVSARGTLRASLAQSCVATGEPVEESVEEPFEIEFRPHPASATPEEEVELGQGELDVVFYDGALVDAGEAVAETLSLSVEAWPRSPAAEEALRAAGVKSEEEARMEASPFAALKDRLER